MVLKASLQRIARGPGAGNSWRWRLCFSISQFLALLWQSQTASMHMASYTCCCPERLDKRRIVWEVMFMFSQWLWYQFLFCPIFLYAPYYNIIFVEENVCVSEAYLFRGFLTEKVFALGFDDFRCGRSHGFCWCLPHLPQSTGDVFKCVGRAVVFYPIDLVNNHDCEVVFQWHFDGFLQFGVVTEHQQLCRWRRLDKQHQNLSLPSWADIGRVFLIHLLDSASNGVSGDLSLWWIYVIWGMIAVKALTKLLPSILAESCHKSVLPS